VKGQKITVAPPVPERRSKLVDIFAALKQSLEQAAPQREAVRERRENYAQTTQGVDRRRADDITWH